MKIVILLDTWLAFEYSGKYKSEMKKQLIFVVALAVSGIVMAQEIETMHPTTASREYRKYREAASEPTFSITKVKAIIKKIKKDQACRSDGIPAPMVRKRCA